MSRLLCLTELLRRLARQARFRFRPCVHPAQRRFGTPVPSPGLTKLTGKSQWPRLRGPAVPARRFRASRRCRWPPSAPGRATAGYRIPDDLAASVFRSRPRAVTRLNSGIAKSLPILQQIRRMASRSSLAAVQPRPLGLRNASFSRHSRGQRACGPDGTIGRRTGTSDSLGKRMAYVSPQGTVPSVTARGARQREKPVNDVGESKYAAIVDRHNC
jgi:hypothetical protein